MDLAVAKMTKLLNLKSIILFLFFFIIAASFIFDLNNAVSFEMIKEKRQDLQNLVDANYILYFVIFFIRLKTSFGVSIFLEATSITPAKTSLLFNKDSNSSGTLEFIHSKLI